MEKQIQQVLAFHQAYNIPFNVALSHVPDELAELRRRLIEEEAHELAMGHSDADIIEIADGVIDCMYILIGTAHTYGFADKLTALFDEVHRSNMSKLGEDGKPILREDGKVLKGPNFTKPQLYDILFY